MDILDINKQRKIERKSKTKNYLIKENKLNTKKNTKKKNINLLWWLLKSLFLQAPNSTLQKRRDDTPSKSLMDSIVSPKV
jgi:hypothetical protein